MHSGDPNKSQDQFNEEVRAILASSSNHHRPKDLFDFCEFALLTADYRKATFAKKANFSGATFTRTADFSIATFTERAIFGDARFIRNAEFGGATFTGDASFDRATFGSATNFGEATFTKVAYFYGANFSEAASFDNATFTEEAKFSQVTFTKAANFRRTSFILAASFHEVTFCDEAFFDDAAFGSSKSDLTTGAETSTIADFRDVRFLKPELVRFLRTNVSATEGLRARFANCHVEGVQFDAVRWHRYDGRMVLQDELDITGQMEGAPSYEETAITYRRLIINFEKARAYDLAEDCTIGEFEMRRRDPSRFIFIKRLGPLYGRFLWFMRWVGEDLSVVGIYRLASIYGTSYHRALAVLGLLLLGFALAFATIIGIHPSPLNPGAISTCAQSSSVGALCSGLLHALEVATLQREVLYKPDSSLGRTVEIFEQVLIAGQAALLLFALRRRFRR